MDWLQFLTSGGVVAALGLALATYLKMRPAMRLAETEAHLKSDEPLWMRIEKLENRISALEKELAQEQALRADLEHDLANEMSNFDALIMYAETSPEKLPQLLPRVKESRLRHRERMATKRGAREGAVIAAAKEIGA